MEVALMLKNLFTFILGALSGIVIMGCIVFTLQSQGKMDWMPIIMLVCVLILVAVAILVYFVNKKKNERRKAQTR